MLIKPEVYFAIPLLLIVGIMALKFDSQFTAAMRSILGERLFKTSGYQLKVGPNRHLLPTAGGVLFIGAAFALIVLLLLGF